MKRFANGSAVAVAMSKRCAPMVMSAIFAAGLVGVASAEDTKTPEFEPAPGYDESFIEPVERKTLNGYGLVEGELPETTSIDRGDGALTEFAGQRRTYNPGIIGGVLGAVKSSIIGKKPE
ncbi:MAG: hypothetical protein MRY74_01770 [Neomegalonema sp.]|nr:hypothetical protein [Neomegalonema sp.]